MRISTGKRLGQMGFTLIELAVVLLIIALLAGGVLAGRSMIRSSELQGILTDENKYIQAAGQFKEHYGYLPGDFPSATSYWGTDPAGCPNSSAYSAAQTTTCNGDGNGLITDSYYANTSGTGAIATENLEIFRAWQQLADAGIIQGAYTGTPGPVAYQDAVPGLNVPATKMANGGYEWAVFGSAGSGPISWWNAQYNVQYLLVGSNSASAPGSSDGGGLNLVHALLTPADALAIDSKIDDGLPATGAVLGDNNIGTSLCIVTNATPNTYNKVLSTVQCTLLFSVKW